MEQKTSLDTTAVDKDFAYRRGEIALQEKTDLSRQIFRYTRLSNLLTMLGLSGTGTFRFAADAIGAALVERYPFLQGKITVSDILEY